MRATGVRRIAFSSTGSIYGEPEVFPTPENAPFPDPDVALRRLEAGRRGADSGLLRGLRLPGLHLPLRLDPRRALHARPRLRLLPEPARAIPRELRVLGNGQQRKSYLYVQDCIDAILTGDRAARRERVNVFNLGTDEYCQVNDSIGWISRAPGRRAGAATTPAASAAGSATARSSSSTRPQIRALGWRPKLTHPRGRHPHARLPAGAIRWLLEARA